MLRGTSRDELKRPSKSDSDYPLLKELQNVTVKKGHLWKKGPKVKSAWRLRFFVLTSQNVMYYFRRHDPDRRPIKHIDLKMHSIDGFRDAKKQHGLQLAPKYASENARVWYIAASGPDDLRSWWDLIKAACTRRPSSVEIKMKNYQISPEDLEFSDQMIGKGATGSVRRGVWLRSTEVAIKTLNNLAEFISEDELAAFYQEIETLSQLRHPNIVSMYGYCKKDSMVCLVTEYVTGGDLSAAIYGSGPLDFPLIIRIAAGIARGMVYLHSKNVIHRDLKPGNILVENLEQGKVKVCDFGLSKSIFAASPSVTVNTYHGSPAYAAPELPTPTHTNRVDVFSFGVLLFCMSTRRKPWHLEKEPWVMVNKINTGEREEIPQPNPLTSLIQACWHHDPEQRPPFTKIFDELARLSPTAVEPILHAPLDFYQDEDLTPEEIINLSFRDQESMLWTDFARLLSKTLGAPEASVDKLRFVLERNGRVERRHWQYLLQWFSPLLPPEASEYHTSEGSGYYPPLLRGWDLPMIVDIVGPSFFFGFLSTADARDYLLPKEPGSFLFRFSTSHPGSYTLSVSHSEGVGHWRVNCIKSAKDPPVFRIESTPYESLHEIVRLHETQPLVSPTKMNIFMLRPCDRSACRFTMTPPSASSAAVSRPMSMEVTVDNESKGADASSSFRELRLPTDVSPSADKGPAVAGPSSGFEADAPETGRTTPRALSSPPVLQAAVESGKAAAPPTPPPPQATPERTLSASESSGSVGDMPSPRGLRKAPSMEISSIVLTEKGFDKLHKAICSNDLTVAKALLSRGADKVRPLLTCLDDINQTPLLSAIAFDKPEFVSLILNAYTETHLDVNMPLDQDGFCTLHLAAMSCTSASILPLLNFKDLQVNVETKRKNTPLHYLAQKFKEENRACHVPLGLLIQRGARVNQRNSKGETPLHYAALNPSPSCIEIARFLLRNGADVNAASNSGETPLHFAIHMAREALMTLLIAHGADVTIKVSDRPSPLELAMQITGGDVTIDPARMLLYLDAARNNGSLRMTSTYDETTDSASASTSAGPVKENIYSNFPKKPEESSEPPPPPPAPVRESNYGIMPTREDMQSARLARAQPVRARNTVPSPTAGGGTGRPDLSSGYFEALASATGPSVSKASPMSTSTGSLPLAGSRTSGTFVQGVYPADSPAGKLSSSPGSSSDSHRSMLIRQSSGSGERGDAAGMRTSADYPRPSAPVATTSRPVSGTYPVSNQQRYSASAEDGGQRPIYVFKPVPSTEYGAMPPAPPRPPSPEPATKRPETIYGVMPRPPGERADAGATPGPAAVPAAELARAEPSSSDVADVAVTPVRDRSSTGDKAPGSAASSPGTSAAGNAAASPGSMEAEFKVPPGLRAPGASSRIEPKSAAATITAVRADSTTPEADDHYTTVE